MNISILCPSRGRPHLLERMMASALKTAVHPERVKIYVYLNHDDPAQDGYLAVSCYTGPEVSFSHGPDAPTAYSWNQLAAQCDGDLLMLMGDDVVFRTRGWDNALEEAAATLPNGVGVLSFEDGRSEVGTAHPHPVMTRKMYEALGYFTCPIFLHWYVDTWMVEIARRADAFRYVAGVVMEHVKPSDTGGADETHNRIRRGVWNQRDKAVYELAEARWMSIDVGFVMEAAHD